MLQLAQPARQMMNMVRTAQNPMLMLNQLASRNPQLQQVMQIVQQYGGDPMRALQSMAEQNGMTADDVLNMLR